MNTNRPIFDWKNPPTLPIVPTWKCLKSLPFKSATLRACTLSLVSVLIAWGSLASSAQAFEPQDDVIVNKEGKWVIGWVLRADGPDHHLVAYNWSAGTSERVENSRIQANRRGQIAPQDKFVSGWTSTQGTLWSIDADPQNKHLAVSAAEGFIQIFEASTFFPVHRIPAWGKAVFSLAFSPDGSALAACEYEGKLKVFDTSTWQATHEIKIGQACKGLAFSSLGQLAISGRPSQAAENHALWLYDIKTKRLSAPLLSAPAEIRHLSSLAFNAQGDHLAIGSSNRQKGVEVFKVTGASLRSIKKLPTAGDVSSVRFSPNGEYIAGSSKADLNLWKWRTGQRFWSVPFRTGSSQFLSALDFAPDGQSIAACGTGRGFPVNIYRTGNGKLKQSLGKTRSMNCNGVRFSSDGQSLFTVRQVYSNFDEKIIDRYDLR